MPNRPRPSLLLTLLSIVLVASCASSGPLVEDRLDEHTGVTVSYSSVPMLFYRQTSWRAAYSREFINMGPVEVNNTGRHRYFLWMSLWRTMQDRTDDWARDGFETITVVADGELFQLDVFAWTPDAIGISSNVYLRPTASVVEAYYQVTADQIRIIAGARDLRIHTSGPDSASYEPWNSTGTARESLLAFTDLMY